MRLILEYDHASGAWQIFREGRATRLPLTETNMRNLMALVEHEAFTTDTSKTRHPGDQIVDLVDEWLRAGGKITRARGASPTISVEELSSLIDEIEL